MANLSLWGKFLLAAKSLNSIPGLFRPSVFGFRRDAIPVCFLLLERLSLIMIRTSTPQIDHMELSVQGLP
jgi:hypothetical protein